MAFNPPEHKPGDPIKASDENDGNAEIRRLGGVRAGPGLAVHEGGGGQCWSVVRPEVIFVKITGGPGANNAYAWKEVYHASPNTWTDATRTGSTTVDPAYPASGDTAVTADDKVYQARRGHTSAEWIFD